MKYDIPKDGYSSNIAAVQDWLSLPPEHRTDDRLSKMLAVSHDGWAGKYTLPCDVALAGNTFILKGETLAALIATLIRREPLSGTM